MPDVYNTFHKWSCRYYEMQITIQVTVVTVILPQMALTSFTNNTRKNAVLDFHQFFQNICACICVCACIYTHVYTSIPICCLCLFIKMYTPALSCRNSFDM